MKKYGSLFLVMLLFSLGQLWAKEESTEDFKREGERAKKDLLEGKEAPKLKVAHWLNTEKPIKLADLKGKVVVLKFWGVW
jgi:hypothetical protein